MNYCYVGVDSIICYTIKCLCVLLFRRFEVWLTNTSPMYSWSCLIPLLWKYRIMHRGLVHGVLSSQRYFHQLWLWGVSRAMVWMQPSASLPSQTFEEWKKWLFVCIVIPLSHFKSTGLGQLNCNNQVNLLLLSIHRLCVCTPEGYPAAGTLVSLWKLALFPQQHFPMGDHSKMS